MAAKIESTLRNAHKFKKPNVSANLDPIDGVSICAMENTTENQATYIPRLESLDLDVQNSFINGMANISDKVMQITTTKRSGMVLGKISCKI